MHESQLSDVIRPAAIEVGLFAANLSAFALEKECKLITPVAFPSKVEKMVYTSNN